MFGTDCRKEKIGSPFFFFFLKILVDKFPCQWYLMRDKKTCHFAK